MISGKNGLGNITLKDSILNHLKARNNDLNNKKIYNG